MQLHLRIKNNPNHGAASNVLVEIESVKKTEKCKKHVYLFFTKPSLDTNLRVTKSLRRPSAF